MKTFRQASRRAYALLLCLVLGSAASAQTPVTVVEYHNSVIGSYFITSRANEHALLDSLPTYRRTGASFAAFSPTGILPAGVQAICRYDIKLPPTFYSSHFYGLPSECATLSTLVLPTFISEGLDFAIASPNAAGVCPLNAPVTVRRVFRPQTPVDSPNHRYTTSIDTYNAMIELGWKGEGPVYCATSATDETPMPDYGAGNFAKGLCEAPRTGINPRTGLSYPDMPGSRADEKNWIRYWVDRSYLWYREVPNVQTSDTESVVDYFKKLKTPLLAFAGGPKDRFSFSTSTKNVEDTNAGVVYGYGIDWAAVRSTPPREWIAAVVDPGSPAAIAGVVRGDRILSIDGIDFVSGATTQAQLDILNRGLFPPTVGESHNFVFQPANGAASKAVTLTAASLPLISVPVSGVIGTPTGKVGYIAFTTFNSFTAEKAIADAVAGLAGQGITDLVLDLRYNGGGYIYISSQLAYMIAGANRTGGKSFERTLTNTKKPFGPDTVYPFYTTGSGFQGGVTAGQALPTLNLNRVFVLTTGGSCSASESFINGLRGIDVPVILIGDTTCGKPYGFSGRDNCGTTYYPIQFTGVNEKGEGDFINGFAPTCAVGDDLTKQLGDPTERQLAAALAYRATGSCPAAPTSSAQKASSLNLASETSNTVGAEKRSFQQMKLHVPADTRRDAGELVVPREPRDLNKQTSDRAQPK
jgi:carboxyl-terminal processing protease